MIAGFDVLQISFEQRERPVQADDHRWPGVAILDPALADFDPGMALDTTKAAKRLFCLIIEFWWFCRADQLCRTTSTTNGYIIGGDRN